MKEARFYVVDGRTGQRLASRTSQRAAVRAADSIRRRTFLAVHVVEVAGR